MVAEIRVGTSGYHFKDWVGTVYPKGLPPSEFLPYYAQMFDCVEVNTSFYRVPERSLFEGMLRKVPEGFVFVVKTPKEMTHERSRFGEVLGPFLDALEPLREAQCLGGLLAQFPYAFRPGPETNAHLERLATTLVDAGIPVNVEFRHDAWARDEVYERLRELGLGFVNVDLPRLSRLPGPSSIATSSTAYYRLHGRNAEMWWEHPTASHRYDYSYAETELKGWTERVEAMRPRVDVAFVFTNNCRMGASIIDALRMKRLFSLDTLIPDSQASADLFTTEPEDPLEAMQTRIDAARELDRPRIDAWRAERAEASGG